jgi:hypothetical protein
VTNHIDLHKFYLWLAWRVMTLDQVKVVAEALKQNQWLLTLGLGDNLANYNMILTVIILFATRKKSYSR